MLIHTSVPYLLPAELVPQGHLRERAWHTQVREGGVNYLLIFAIFPFDPLKERNLCS